MHDAIISYLVSHKDIGSSRAQYRLLFYFAHTELDA